MATDVKNIDGGDTGNVENGRSAVLIAQAGSTRIATLDSAGLTLFSIADFDNSPPGCVLADRLDDPRYYTGDTSS